MLTTRISVWLLLIGLGIIALSDSVSGEGDLNFEEHGSYLVKREPKKKGSSSEEGGLGDLFGGDKLKKGFEKMGKKMKKGWEKAKKGFEKMAKKKGDGEEGGDDEAPAEEEESATTAAP